MADNLNIKNPSVTEDALAIHLDASGNIDRISGHGIAGTGGGGGSMNYYGDDVYIKNTGAAGNIFTLTESVKAKLEQIQPSYTQGTDIIVDEYNTIQVNTNGSANSTGMAFVEGIDTVASGVASHAEGKLTSAMSDYSHTEGYKNIDYEIPGQIGSNHTEGAYNNVSGVYTHIEGHANGASGYGLHMEGGYNRFVIHNMSADKNDPDGRWNIWGISIEGMANATTAEPYSGTIGEPDFGYIHGGILKVIGNGTRTKTDESDPSTEVINRSDALIIYRDGCISAAGKISANGVELGAGGGTTYQGRNGVNVDGGYIELTTTAYESVTSVPSISNDVNTLKGASGDWNKVSDKLDTTAFSTVSGDFVINNDLNDYYKKTETSSKEALETAFGNKQDNLTQEQLSAISSVSSKLTKASADTLYAPISVTSDVDTLKSSSGDWNKVSDKLDTTAFSTVSGDFLTAHQSLTNYYKKSETSGASELSDEFAKYVTSSNVTTQGTDYVMTTTGWKVLTLPGGGMTQVIHDETLTGQGNDDDNKLGVAWSALSGNTINSAKSATVATEYYDATQTDTFNIAESINNLNDDIEYVSGQVDNKVNKPTSTQTGKLVYDSDTSAWSDIGLDEYVPYSATNLAIGSEVIASSYSFAQGWDNSANWNSVTFGTHSTAYSRSLALGENAVAYSHSISIGGGADSHCNSADGQSIAVGNGVSARYRSIAVGSHSTVADTNALSIGGYCVASGTGSVAIGFRNSAYSVFDVGGGQAFGRSLEISGGLAIGYYNATKDAAFVIGNGSGNDDDTVVNRSDSFVIYRDGSVSAKGNISANGVELGGGGGASLTLPVNVGTGNDVTQTSAIGAIGNNCSAGTKSFALSYKGATAYSNSFVVNDDNVAGNNSFAWGWGSKATNYSLAGGNNTSADAHSFILAEGTSNNNSFAKTYSLSLGNGVYSDYYSIAFGNAVTANCWTYAFGRGLNFSGSSASTGIGALVAGGWNKTTSNAIFVLGNGTGDNSLSDALVVYRNGAIKAGSDTTAKESNSVAFGSLSQASGNCAFVAGAWCTAIGQGAHAEGNSCGTTGYGNHIQGSFNTFESTGSEYNGPANTPVFVGGTLNYTTAQNYNDHGGYLQIMGNGTYQSQGTGTRSDAYILYRDGTVSAKQFQNADGTETINGTTYNFTGVDNIEILPLEATANTANFPNDNVLRFILES